MSITIKDGSVAPTTTYQDGPGNPNQGSLFYAVNVNVWWYLQVNSANDVAGNPGTHKISAYYNSSGDPAAGSWTYYGDSPNLDANSGSTSCKFDCGLGGGRSMACAYYNNSAGANKDQAILYGCLQSTAGQGTCSGVIRALMGASSITWGNWGGWNTAAWTLAGGSTAVLPSPSVGITADGYVQMAACTMHSELDCNVCTSVDPLADTWNEGNITGTANTTASSALVTNMSTQARLKVGMALSSDATDWNTDRFPKINSINSGTQVTMQTTATASGTNQGTRWWQGTPGSTRTSTMIDSTMVHECSGYNFCPLASNGMLLIYGNGSATNGDFGDMLSMKANQTQAAGFWPSTTDGTGSAAVFGTTVTIKNNDWSGCSVSTSAIYCARRTGTTTVAVRNYNTATNGWQAITNAPPTMTGKNIVAGGGVCLVSDGTDMWLLVIDSTDAQVKYVKYTHGTNNTNGTWGSWTNLAAVGATAAFLTAVVGNGYICAAWSEKNADATHYDTKAATLSIGAHFVPQLPEGWEECETLRRRLFLIENQQVIPNCSS